MLHREWVRDFVFRFCQHAVREAEAAIRDRNIRASTRNLAGMRRLQPAVDGTAAKCAVSAGFFPREMRTRIQEPLAGASHILLKLAGSNRA